MNAPLTTHPTPPYKHTPLFPLGKDKTPYRKISADGVRVEKVMGKDVLVVPREALRALAEAAFTDINHLLRPAHLASAQIDPRRPGGVGQRQVRRLSIFSRTPTSPPAACCRCARTPAPPSSWARRAGWCSPTATTRRRSPKARATPISSAICAIRSSRRSPCSRRRTPRTTCRRRSRSMPRAQARTRRLQVPVHRQGRRLGQQGVFVPGDAVDPDPRPHAGVPQGEGADARHRGVPALSSRHRHRRHLGRADHEDGEARLDANITTSCPTTAPRTATPSAIWRWSRKC